MTSLANTYLPDPARLSVPALKAQFEMNWSKIV
jgi:hypothetical protein